MSRKQRVVVDLPDELYKQIKELAGGAANVSSFVYKEIEDNMRARAAAIYQKNSTKGNKCPSWCRVVTRKVNSDLCPNCRLLFGH